MNKRKCAASVITMSVAMLFGAGVLAAAAGAGSQEDPLVTLSYLTDVAVPQASAKIDSVIASEKAKITADIEKKFETLRGEISAGGGSGSLTQENIAQITNAVIDKVGASQGGATWSEVSLEAGTTVVLGNGADAILRSGAANCYGASGTGLINISSGETISAGKPAAANNLYNSPADGRGFTATSAAKFIIRGSFTKK